MCQQTIGYFKYVMAMWKLKAHPHLLARATNERFLLTRATFRSILASKNHWLQPVLVLTVRWWPAPVSVGGRLVAHGHGPPHSSRQ